MRSYKYDVFISHAVEDKIGIATELCQRLEEKGLKIWYSGKALVPGASLEESIRDGLINSRYCIAILSPNYFQKSWPRREFDGFYFQENRKVIIPVLYNITPEEVAQHLPTLSDKWGLKAEKGMDYLVDTLYQLITKRTGWVVDDMRWLVGGVVALVTVAIAFIMATYSSAPSTQELNDAIDSRIAGLTQKANFRLAEMKRQHARAVDSVYIDSIFNSYAGFKSYYRNSYSLDNGFQVISAKKNVEAQLDVAVKSMLPLNHYGLKTSHLWILQGEDKDGKQQVTYALVNDLPVIYEEGGAVEIAPGQYLVTVDFQNNIRFIEVTLTFARHAKDTKTHEMNIVALKPRETYMMKEADGRWMLREVNPDASETN